MPRIAHRRTLWTGVAASVLLAACATQPGDPCNAGQVALIGAVAGAVLGAATAKDRNSQGSRAAKGAVLVGAGAALACMAVNASSRQTKSAEAANEEARRRAGTLPPAATLVAYDAAVEPVTVRPGSDVLVRSVVEVADGTREPVSDLREILTLRDTEGKEHRLKEKPVGERAGRAGRFENTFSFQLPRGVSQGVYGVRTQLLLNGRAVAQREATMQLVDAGSLPQAPLRLAVVAP